MTKQSKASPAAEDPTEDLQVSQFGAAPGSPSGGQASAKPGFEHPRSAAASSPQPGGSQGVLPPLPAAAMAGRPLSAGEDAIEDLPEAAGAGSAMSTGSSSARPGFDGPPTSAEGSGPQQARAVLPQIGTS